MHHPSDAFREVLKDDPVFVDTSGITKFSVVFETGLNDFDNPSPESVKLFDKLQKKYAEVLNKRFEMRAPWTWALVLNGTP